MLFILGKLLDENKLLLFELTKIYGIGLERAKYILNKFKLKFNTKLINETDKISEELIKYILLKEAQLEDNLRFIILQNLNKKKSIKCYQGLRYAKHLPVRGQRTKTNSKTAKNKNK